MNMLGRHSQVYEEKHPTEKILNFRVLFFACNSFREDGILDLEKWSLSEDKYLDKTGHANGAPPLGYVRWEGGSRRLSASHAVVVVGGRG